MKASQIPRSPVPSSSNVHSCGYDPLSRILTIQFHAASPIYAYHNGPPHTHADLLAAHSKGSFVHSHIKGKFPVFQEPSA
jgi:hypothetical protein